MPSLWCWCCCSSSGNQPIFGAWRAQPEPHGVGKQYLPPSPRRMIPALDRNVMALWVRNPRMCSLEAQCFQQAGRPGILTSRLAHVAEAGMVVVPVPGIPSLVPGRLHAGQGRWGVALGRTSCLETCRKGKPRCHLPSDQEAQVSFPSARTGAWEAASQGESWGCKQFGQGLGVGWSPAFPSERGLAHCPVCPLLLCERWLPPACVCTSWGLGVLWGTCCHPAVAPPVPTSSCDSVPGSCLVLLQRLSFTHSLLLLAGPWEPSPADARVQLESRAPDEVMPSVQPSPAWFVL